MILIVGEYKLCNIAVLTLPRADSQKNIKNKNKNMATWANKKRMARKLKRRNRTKLSKNKR